MILLVSGAVSISVWWNMTSGVDANMTTQGATYNQTYNTSVNKIVEIKNTTNDELYIISKEVLPETTPLVATMEDMDTIENTTLAPDTHITAGATIAHGLATTEGATNVTNDEVYQPSLGKYKITTLNITLLFFMTYVASS